MKRNEIIRFWTFCLPLYVIVHSAIALGIFCVGFGMGEANVESVWLDILGYMIFALTPLLPLYDRLTPPLPDSMLIFFGCIFGSALFWWGVIALLLKVWSLREPSSAGNVRKEKMRS